MNVIERTPYRTNPKPIFILGFDYCMDQDGFFKCNKCFRRYKRRHGVVQHQRYECGKSPQFKCGVCSRTFAHKASLKYHVKCLHMTQKDS
ncbi:hypothetical protein GWI33_014880 [Rhynchophorus ferrugineus]|uniref:C2H2-type domain-containing protein n=1 Tax=Rhynchophorus ferrugineus TaxID=354439 RepID=A0A834I4A5_RHYFE|nr:hypothetical protein GWI33_014880 [Rhynchophorus ferrugineus]